MHKNKSIFNLTVTSILLIICSSASAYTFKCVGTEKNHQDNSTKPFVKNIVIADDLSAINYKPVKESDTKQFIFTEESIDISKTEKVNIKSSFNPNFLTFSTSVEQGDSTLISTESNCELLINPFKDNQKEDK